MKDDSLRVPCPLPQRLCLLAISGDVEFPVRSADAAPSLDQFRDAVRANVSTREQHPVPLALRRVDTGLHEVGAHHTTEQELRDPGGQLGQEVWRDRHTSGDRSE